MFIVQEYVAGAWKTIDKHDGDKPQPLTFANRSDAKAFCKVLCEARVLVDTTHRATGSSDRRDKSSR